MTSKERKEARFQRRKSARQKKKDEYALNDCFDWVFSYEHLYDSYRKCRKGVAWKASTQRYISEAPLNVWKVYDALQKGKFKSKGFFEFDVMERGKARHIKSVTIEERVVQRCLCDYALVPVLSRTFIYDNGACMKDKGYTFTAKRLEEHLHRHFRRYGTEGYVLQFDFSKFFDRISHGLLKKIIHKEFTDKRLIALMEYFIDMFGDIGIGLGSQISQILALASANYLDHYIKEVLHIKGYARYNDDGYLIHHSKDYLRKCLEEIRRICKKLEITINEKKTKITKLTHGFTFMKTKYFLLKSGKVLKKIYHKSVVKMRRKLKVFAQKVRDGKMKLEDVRDSYSSWEAYAKRADAHRTILNTKALFYTLFSDRAIAA